MGRALIALCVLPAVALAQAPPRVEDLRERATAYVEQFIGRFSGVAQESSPCSLSPGGIVGAWRAHHRSPHSDHHRTRTKD